MSNVNDNQPMGLAHPSLRDSLLSARYLRRNKSNGLLETVDEMYRRVATTIAKVEGQYGGSPGDVDHWTKAFYRMMIYGRFLPNSPTLMNAGTDSGVLSACYVLPINDSIEGIFTAVKNAAIVQKAGGGTGFSFDHLRPAGDRVNSSGGTTSGPISFLGVFSETSHSIQQGSLRRGANMAAISINHPDVLKFIAAKQRPEALSNFNISIKVSDPFLGQLRREPDSLHVVVNPRDNRKYVIPSEMSFSEYELNDLKPFSGQPVLNCLTVQDVWNEIVRHAHASGEPGVVFIDRINKCNPTPHVGYIEAMNPCGEQPLLDYECCNLGSLNVSAFVNGQQTDLDWDLLKRTARQAVRFLDNVIDANRWPLEQQREITLSNRKIGLGIMGLADAMILLGIRYDSDRAVSFCNKLASYIQEQSHKASLDLAGERGCFPNWEGSIWDTEYSIPMRNATCTTVAPTGSISLLAECSNGIEPVYHWVMRRRAIEGQDFVQIHPLLERLGRRKGWLNEETRAQLVDGCPIKDVSGIPSGIVDSLVTAHEVSPEWHCKIQGAFQRHVDNAVSKTINLPGEASVDEVDRAFQLAYDHGCKGVTVYRDGSREGQVLSCNDQNVGTNASPRGLRPRANVTAGHTSKFRMGCGTLFVTVNRDEHGICEVFANLGKAGGCPSQSEATCRVVSAALRSGVAPEILIDQLSNIRCLSAVVACKKDSRVNVLSCPDAIARALRQASSETSLEARESRSVEICPECGGPTRKEGGCVQCDCCGFNRCG